MRLVIDEIETVLSIPTVMDVVFYRDGEDNLYRLQWIEKSENNSVPKDEYKKIIKIFHQVVFLECYAPEVIDGEIIFNSEKIMKIIDRNKNIYRLEKNANKSEFLDVSALKIINIHRNLGKGNR